MELFNNMLNLSILKIKMGALWCFEYCHWFILSYFVLTFLGFMTYYAFAPQKIQQRKLSEHHEWGMNEGPNVELRIRSALVILQFSFSFRTKSKTQQDLNAAVIHGITSMLLFCFFLFDLYFSWMWNASMFFFVCFVSWPRKDHLFHFAASLLFFLQSKNKCSILPGKGQLFSEQSTIHIFTPTSQHHN